MKYIIAVIIGILIIMGIKMIGMLFMMNYTMDVINGIM